MEPENRAHPRHRVVTDCVIRSRHGIVAEETIDTSWDGVRASAVAPVLTGEEVEIALRVPRSHFWLRAAGRVARVVHGRRWEDRAVAIGVALTSMHGFDRVLWGQAIARYPSPPAERGPDRDYARSVRQIASGQS